ncbi:hypothetical protein BDN70DRAFT_882209 [Pholiota conissans]|uniref:Uncharacterized protein n=1 Tax=Pholiota conissans TaxID=109636 RepID=A0A9P5YVP7_9AGAR|nr:hypothetical protein BDN70DRAFT_882209 [Pholiota conissans]
MQMPNVFVTPPEEDETPAWCFFDADNPNLSRVTENPDSPDITVYAFPSDMEPPRYYRNPDAVDAEVMPRRPSESISVVDALNDAHGDDDDNDSDTESDYGRETSLDEDPQSIRESARHPPRDIRNVADDSDVIEVVKVSRRSRISEPATDPQSILPRQDVKRTQTLKNRASKVFRSLKGTLRSSSKPRAQDVFNAPPPVPPVPPLPSHSDSEPMPREDAPTRPRTPTVARRGSKMLSQLFTGPSLKSRTSISSFDDPSVTSPRNSVTSPTSSVFSIGNSVSRQPSIYSVATQDAQDEARLRATSPTPTTSSSKSASRRFSMLSLQKLFNFSPSSSQAPPISVAAPIVPDGDSGRTTPTPRSTTSTPPSVLSSAGPQTPTSCEEVNHVRLVSQKDTADIPGFDSFESVFDTNVGLNLGLGLGLNLDSNLEDVEKTPRKPSRVASLKNTWEAVTPRRFSRAAPPPTDLDDEGDMSLEMRLDSFHFDDLSFDADNFVTH